MLDSIKPGQDIVCTVTSQPRTDDTSQTIARLMRRDPANAKALRKGQMRRKRITPIHQRGGRRWFVRQKVGKVVHAVPGASWTMTYTPDLAPDLRSVAAFIEIKGK